MTSQRSRIAGIESDNELAAQADYLRVGVKWKTVDNINIDAKHPGVTKMGGRISDNYDDESLD